MSVIYFTPASFTPNPTIVELTPQFTQIDGLGQASGTIVHDVVGSSDTSVTVRPGRKSNGTIRYLFDDYATAAQCRELHAAGGMCILARTEGVGGTLRYVAVDDVTHEVDADTYVSIVSVRFQEV